MTHSSIAMVSRLRLVELLLPLLFLTSAFAFSPLPMNARATTSRSFGVPLDLDPSFGETLTTTSIIISAAKATTATAASGSSAAAVSNTVSGASGSSVAVNFFAGSAVFIGIIAAFKWNDAEYSDQIRESWEKLVDSTSSFGTAPPSKPSVARMESSVPSEVAPPTTEIPVVPVATPATSVAAVSTTTSNPIPSPKDASSPEDLIDMMKKVSIETAPKKKRFIVRLLKKIVMPWKKWSNL